MRQHSDMTPVVDLTLEKGAGPFRTRRPVYVDLLAPCDNACPAGEPVQAWLALAQAGKFRAAWETLVRDNPLPAVHGRVCYHPCESACNRETLDAAVSIHAVERFLGDLALTEGWPFPVNPRPGGERVLVVGAGPCGLAAAYHLTCLGHMVEIREAGPVAGGMMHFGIPAYRLPRGTLASEIDRIAGLGVRITCNHKVEDLLAERDAGGFDAVFVAIGAQVSRHAEIPARDAARVLDAVSLLRAADAGAAPRLGRRIVVYGGGNTAMDAARTARRLGADEVLIVYRRDRAHMPARAFEADEAIAEGIKIRWLTSIKEVVGPSLTVERMILDANGRPQPTGKFETLTADAVVLALGQETDSRFLRRVPGIAFTTDGGIVVDPQGMTGHPGIFAGGDTVPGERSVAAAVGMGKHAARAIGPRNGRSSYRSKFFTCRCSPMSWRPLNRFSTLPNGLRTSKRWWPGSPKPRRAMRRNAASPAAIALNATIAGRPVPRMRSSNSAPAGAIAMTTRNAPDVRRVSSNAHVTRST